MATPLSWERIRARYFVRKPLAHLRRQAAESKLAKTLGVWELTALGIGGIIGAGIFTTTGIIIGGYTGPAIAVSFLVAAVVSALAGLAYAELASMLPLGGSAYTYAYASFGELVAWVLGWALLLEYAIGNMAVASGFSANFSALLDAAGAHLPTALRAAPCIVPPCTASGIIDLPALFIVVLVTLLLLRPVKESARTNLILVIAKIAIIALFLVIALPNVKSANLTPFAPFGLFGVLAGASLIFFSFIGFDAVSTAAEETRNPQRDVPRGILFSLGACTVFYILVGLGLTGVVNYKALATSGDPLAAVLNVAGYPGVAIVMNLGGILATVSVLLVFQLGTSRIFFTLARDGLIPEAFTRVSPRWKTPTRITLVSGAFVAVFAALLPLTLLLQLTNIGTLFAFAIVMAGVLYLRKHEPDAPRPFKMPGTPWTVYLGILMCIGLIWTLPNLRLTLLGFLMWMGLGLMIYAAYGARHSRLRGVQGAEPPEVESKIHE